jgi:hypothetical protein
LGEFIEQDDDGTTVGQTARHKQRLVESDPEDLFDVPDGMGPNSMAPTLVKKSSAGLMVKQDGLQVPGPLLPNEIPVFQSIFIDQNPRGSGSASRLVSACRNLQCSH